jgi:hypothetical protein
MMLSFTGGLEDISNGRKTTTLRADRTLRIAKFIKHRYDRGEPAILDLHWRNPRYRHPEHFKIGTTSATICERIKGRHFTRKVANMDGFYSDYPVDDLIERLGELNEMTYEEVWDYTWTRVGWGNKAYLLFSKPPKGNPAWQEFERGEM